MMSEFPMKKLAVALRQRSEFFEIDDFTRYKRCRVQLHAQGIVERDEVPGAEIKTKRQQVCHAREFLVAEIDAKLGGFGLVPESLEGAIVSNHYFLFTIDETLLDRRFLDYYTRTRAFIEQVHAQGSTNYAAIRAGNVLDYEIPLPPLAEQQRIVARVEELAAKIEEARGLKRTSVQDAATFWKTLSRVARETNYPERTLAQIAVFLDGRRVPLSETQRAGRRGPYPYYGASGIIDSLDDFIFDEELLLLSEDGANLLTRTTPIAFVVSGKCWVNNHAHVLRPLPGLVDVRFLAYALADYDVSIFNFASAQAKLNQANARKIALPLPPLAEQRRLVAHLDALQARVDTLKRVQLEVTAELDALFPSILARAFRGAL